VNTNFEWMRIALAMALMGGAFLALPAYFLWHDNRKAERDRARAGLSDTSPDVHLLPEDPNR
jgi:hypothetical protein